MITALFLALAVQATPSEIAADAAVRADEMATYGRVLTAEERATVTGALRDAAAAAGDATDASYSETPGQDIEWAASVAATRSLLRLTFRPGLTDAQMDACAQVADRLGAWRRQRTEHRTTQYEADDQRRRLIAETGDTGASPALLELISTLSDASVRDGDRASHAMMSTYLTFCRP